MRKKKILFQSDAAVAKTGFGRNSKEILSYLYNTGKYEIFHYCCGCTEEEKPLDRTPWKSIGTMPKDQQVMASLAQDPQQGREVNYGGYFVNDAIKKYKPDVFIGVQDIWGVESMVKKPWFDKILQKFLRSTCHLHHPETKSVHPPKAQAVLFVSPKSPKPSSALLPAFFVDGQF